MTERFTLKHFESQDWAYDNNKPIHTKEMVNLLNELHEENQLLLKASEKDSELIKTLRKGIHQWRKENEWLKERIKEYLE